MLPCAVTAGLTWSGLGAAGRFRSEAGGVSRHGQGACVPYGVAAKTSVLLWWRRQNPLFTSTTSGSGSR